MKWLGQLFGRKPTSSGAPPVTTASRLNRRERLKCGKCGAEYVLGENAICLTSEELSSMCAAVVGTMQTFLTIDTTQGGNCEQLRKDRETILQLGPSRGWDCKKCEHHNQWSLQVE